VTCEECRAPVGIETQRQWSDHASARSTPLLCGLSSRVALCGRALHPDGPLPVTQAAWDRTQTATCRDVLAPVRRHLWNLRTFPTALPDPGVVFVSCSPLERVSWAVCSCVGQGQSQAHTTSRYERQSLDENNSPDEIFGVHQDALWDDLLPGRVRRSAPIAADVLWNVALATCYEYIAPGVAGQRCQHRRPLDVHCDTAHVSGRHSSSWGRNLF